MEDYIKKGKLSLSVYFYNTSSSAKQHFKEWLMQDFFDDIKFFNKTATEKAVEKVNAINDS